MTGLVRKATLFGVCALLAASAALANVPDPATSTAPAFAYCGGYVITLGPDQALPGDGTLAGPIVDPLHPYVVTVKDFSGLPVANTQVCVHLPCDINLCTDPIAGQTVTCPGPNGGSTVCAMTNVAGAATFYITGAAKHNVIVNPCVFPGVCIFAGGGENSTLITVDGYVGTFKTTTTVCIDQNGSSGAAGANDVTAADVSFALNDIACYALGTLGHPEQFPVIYKGRADLNLSGIAGGGLTAADASFLQIQVARYVFPLGGHACTPQGSPIYCAPKPACP
jgi:hypothetical protein